MSTESVLLELPAVLEFIVLEESLFAESSVELSLEGVVRSKLLSIAIENAVFEVPLIVVTVVLYGQAYSVGHTSLIHPEECLFVHEVLSISLFLVLLVFLPSKYGSILMMNSCPLKVFLVLLPHVLNLLKDLYVVYVEVLVEFGHFCSAKTAPCTHILISQLA